MKKGKEFARKVSRTLTGNYQLLRLAPWLISPANPLLFRFISHKLLRLLVPLLLVFILDRRPLSDARAALQDCLLAPDRVLCARALRRAQALRQKDLGPLPSQTPL